jgi:hypothetical protein
MVVVAVGKEAVALVCGEFILVFEFLNVILIYFAVSDMFPFMDISFFGSGGAILLPRYQQES